MIANSIVDYFSQEQNLKLIDTLINLGIKIQEKDSVEQADNFFSNKTIVITGSLENYSRDELSKLLENNQAKVSGSVSKKTDYVIYGSSPGSKYEKALELGVRLIDENELINILNKENMYE